MKTRTKIEPFNYKLPVTVPIRRPYEKDVRRWALIEYRLKKSPTLEYAAIPASQTWKLERNSTRS
jgi:hypothetical protein